MIFTILLLIFTVVGFWKVFDKAGKPGWYSLIPILNTITALKIAGKPWWWIFLLCIPVINVIILVIAYMGLAKNFGKGTGFAIGLALLPFIFFMILGYGDAEYKAVE